MTDLEKIARALGINKTIDDYNFYYGEYGLSSEEAERIKHDWLVDDICDRIAELVAKVEGKDDEGTDN